MTQNENSSTCSSFIPQAWRPHICRTCFNPKSAHSSPVKNDPKALEKVKMSTKTRIQQILNDKKINATIYENVVPWKEVVKILESLLVFHSSEYINEYINNLFKKLQMKGKVIPAVVSGKDFLLFHEEEERKLKSKDITISALKKKVAEQAALLKEKNKVISDMKEDITSKDDIIQLLKKRVEKKKRAIKEWVQLLSSSHSKIKWFQDRIRGIRGLFGIGPRLEDHIQSYLTYTPQ